MLPSTAATNTPHTTHHTPHTTHHTPHTTHHTPHTTHHTPHRRGREGEGRIINLGLLREQRLQRLKPSTVADEINCYNRAIAIHLLSRLNDFSQWGLCIVLDAILKYTPTEDEIYEILVSQFINSSSIFKFPTLLLFLIDCYLWVLLRLESVRR